jgi:hypothetical protein
MRRAPNLSNQPRLVHGKIHFTETTLAAGAIVNAEDAAGPQFRGCKAGDLVVASPDVENLQFSLHWRADVTLQGGGKTIVTIRVHNSGSAPALLQACDFSYVVIPT